MSDMILFFFDGYNEEHWNSYANCFSETDVHIAGIPQDIVNVVVGLFGNEAGAKWLMDTPLTQFNEMRAIDVLQTPKGEMAFKAFIMRLPC